MLSFYFPLINFRGDNYPDTGGVKAEAIVHFSHKTITSFVYSLDPVLGLEHVPNHSYLTPDIHFYIYDIASLFWQKKLEDGFKDLVMGWIDVMKYCAVNGFNVPTKYSHVILDESQTANKPFYQILDRSPQAVISFNDPRQNLKGLSNSRNESIKSYYLSKSYRAGIGFSELIEPVIQSDSFLQSEFSVNTGHKTKVIIYDRASIPSKPMPMIVYDEWGAFEWAQKLSMKGIKFSLNGTKLDKFIEGLLDLNASGVSTHYQLAQYTSLKQAVYLKTKHLSHDLDTVYHRVMKIIEGGYKWSDWDKCRSKIDNFSEYIISTVPKFVGRESFIVWIAPCIGEHMNVKNTDKDLVEKVYKTKHDIALAALYMSLTRVVSVLYIPRRLRESIEDL